MLDVLLSFSGIGLLFILLGIPLIRRLVPPNPLYGFRLPATLRDRALWYTVNRRTGWLVVALGVAEIVAAVGLYPLHLKRSAYAQLLTGVLAVGTILMTLCSFLYLRQQQRR